MLKRYQNTLACPDCGRSWHFMSDGLMTGDPCPSDDCPSNAQTPLSIIDKVCKDFEGNGIFSVGAIGALKAMAHHWKDHLAEGHNPKIISEDIDEMARQLEVMRAEIMRRIQTIENPNPVTRNDLEVSLNGGTSWQPAPEGVRIAYKNVMIDGEDGRGEVHIHATHEGLITDIWTHREPPMVSDAPYDHNIGTVSIQIEDIVSRLVEENA